MAIKLIYACDRFGGIGTNGDLPWPRIKEDMRFFRETTSGHAVIMGWKTWESLGKKPLPNRYNVILTGNKDHQKELIDRDESGVDYIPTPETVLSLLEENPDIQDWFIIGGGSVYHAMEKYAEEILCTFVDAVYPCDVSFTPEGQWWQIERRLVAATDEHPALVFGTYHRRVSDGQDLL